MLKYFLQSTWVGKLESYREELTAVKMRYQKNPGYDFDIFNRESISSTVLFM